MSMERAVKLLIFDLDGTLVNAYRAVALSLNHALTHNGYGRLDDQMIKRSVGWGEKVLVEKFVRAEDVDQVLSVYRHHHKIALKSGTRFLPGVKKAIGGFRSQGYLMAVATNRPSAFTRIILNHLGVFDFFCAVVCADQVARPKPEADVLWEILARTKLAQEESIYVGDMALDVETGRKAGIRTVSVLTGSCTKEEILAQRPYRLIGAMEELDTVLKELEK